MIRWKEIKGFEKTHKISTDGDIIKLIYYKNGYSRWFALKPNYVKRVNCKDGCNITLIDGDKRRYTTVGRLVAETFIDNPNNYKQVNHKDGNCKNNKVSNLEWCNACQNKHHVKIKIFEKEYNNLSQAERETGINKEKLNRICDKNINPDIVYLNKQPMGLDKVEDLPNEEWKYLQGTLDQFMISNKGRVKSCVRNLANGRIIYGEKLVKQTITDGKARINTRIYHEDGYIERKFFTVLNEVYRHFIDDYIPSCVYLKNIDGDKLNCSVENIGVG